MSKAAKKILGIVVALLVVVLAYAGMTTMDKQKLEQENVGLQKNLQMTESKVKQGLAANKKLKGDLGKLESEVKRVKKNLDTSKKKADTLNKKIKNSEKDRDKYKKRLDNVKKERDDLMSSMQGLKNDKNRLEDKLAEAIEMKMEAPVEESSKSKRMAKNSKESSVERRSKSMSSTSTSAVDEAYWAQLLQDKASLEIKIRELEGELADNSLEIVDLTQSNSEIKIELDELEHDHESLQRDMAHKEGLVNNLALELARAKNDKKFISDRSKKLSGENSELRSQLKMLSSTKSALEKSIVRLTKDKQKIEGELGKTETIIQSKIDEIWEIKDSIDQTLKTSSKTSVSSDVELSPIVVSSDGSTNSFNTAVTNPGINGKVVSVNTENNFLIVNVGQNSGVSVGDKLSVYRDSKYLASLEVIQVRNDIAAADIKDQWTRIEVGDLVQ